MKGSKEKMVTKVEDSEMRCVTGVYIKGSRALTDKSYKGVRTCNSLEYSIPQSTEHSILQDILLEKLEFFRIFLLVL